MKSMSHPTVATVVTAAFFLLSSLAQPAATAIVEHTFVVSKMNMTHLCNEILVTVVNGQLPGPLIEVTEGDSVTVHVVNMSPYRITIHWHGVKQRLNCWADGVPMISQCPILPNHNLTYRFNVTEQEGTLWWHAHVACLRATLHGALIIRPRHGGSSYPFPKPDREIPIIIGEWWEVDLVHLDRTLMDGYFGYVPSAAMISGKLGDLYNCSGTTEDGYELEVEPGKTYLLRIINAALTAEYFLKIAGHKFTVVAADANYVNPFTTEIIAVAPGETVDALLVADAAPGSYYMVALANQQPIISFQLPTVVTRGTVKYNSINVTSDAPMVPEMPDQPDMVSSFYFHGNLSGLRHTRRLALPEHVDERLFITLSAGSVCRHGGQSCKRGWNPEESITVVTMNNFSFQFPDQATTTLLEAHYTHRNQTATGGGIDLYTLPDRPLRRFNFTDPTFIPYGSKEESLEPTEKATTVRRFRHGAVVEVVFQSTALIQSDYNPMHLHGHDMFVLAQGFGNYDAMRDVARYNLVDPPLKNTVLVPSLGWAAIRFVANNPGVWFFHCHYDFHLPMGMATVFIVEDGPTVDSALPRPPGHLPKCKNGNSIIANEQYIRAEKSDVHVSVV